MCKMEPSAVSLDRMRTLTVLHLLDSVIISVVDDLLFLNDSLFQFEIETPFIPSELNPEFMKLTEFSALAVEAVIPAAKAYFKAPETVPDKISRAYFYEKEAVKYSQTIKRTVFHNMPSLKLSEKFHLRYFAPHIENLAKGAENVADQLAVMAIRRTL